MLDQRRLGLAHTTNASREREADLIESLYRAARDPRDWPKSLSLLATRMGAEVAMIARYDPARGASSVSGSAVPPRLADTSETSDSVRLIAQQISKSLTTGGNVAGGAPQIVRVADPNTGGGERTHVVLPHIASCHAGGAAWFGVVLRREEPQRERMVRILEGLHGHLMCALDIALELAGTRQAAGATVTVLGALPSAALTLDAGGHIVHANAAARGLLLERDGVIETPERRLRASAAREDQRLASAIHATLAAGSGEPIDTARQAVRVRRSAGTSPLLIILDPVPLLESTPFQGRTSAVLVRLINEKPFPDGRLYPLHAAFDLTAAETRIAASIASGHSPATAARHLDLSTNTVRTHLARVFDKTGTRSQHALTLLLAAIGSWPLR